jgi:hypothetical protein
MADEDETRLELYKLAVEMTDRTSARRAGANSFFVTLNAALATAIGLLSAARQPPKQGKLPTFDAFGLSVAAIAGIGLALTWWLLLRYYRRLNKAKFEVILEMEQSLPDQPYTKEWAALHPEEAQSATGNATTAPPSWWQRNRHREASVVEQVVPFVFAAIYAVLIIRVTWFR